MFRGRVRGTASVQPIGISEDRRRLFKRDTMFLKVGNRLRDVPCKHIIVYTLIRSWSQGLRARKVGLVCGAERDGEGLPGSSCLSGLFRYYDNRTT